jgi:PRTRC genetic system protein B
MLEVHVSERGQAATLSGAILLYGGKNRQSGHGEESSFATVHPVSEVNSRMEIMPGRLLTQKDLATLTKSLAKTEATAVNATRWLDSRILATGPDRMIWWTPPHQRAMFFETSEAAKLEIAGSGACPVPGMVWMAMPGNGLFVFAVKGTVRPMQSEQLYQAPFFNVWSRGKVCTGSAELPSTENRWEVQAWENTFFGSRFTHPNFTEKDRLIKGAEPCLFWKKMLAKPAAVFPERRLVQFPMVVGDLLDPLVVDKLNKVPKAKGEF